MSCYNLPSHAALGFQPWTCALGFARELRLHPDMCLVFSINSWLPWKPRGAIHLHERNVRITNASLDGGRWLTPWSAVGQNQNRMSCWSNRQCNKTSNRLDRKAMLSTSLCALIMNDVLLTQSTTWALLRQDEATSSGACQQIVAETERQNISRTTPVGSSCQLRSANDVVE